MRIYVLMTLLLEAWSLIPDQSELFFNPGESVNLTCTNKTWTETFYLLWNLHLKNRNCSIRVSRDKTLDDCKDGKSVVNTSMLVLNIPNISSQDVGDYICENSYRTASGEMRFHLSLIVPPEVTSWLELRDGKMVAVCRAEGGNPAANISWSLTGNSLPKTSKLSDGLFRVESSLEVPEGQDTENISCVVSHPSWQENRTLVPRLQTGKGYLLWIFILVIVVVFFSGGVLFLTQKKLIIWRRCQKSDSSSLKPPPNPKTEEVEEVEPYASYVQRVNTIYNSSVDLFE